MNTTAKGDAFEKKVEAAVKEALSNGDFSIGGKYYKVFRKKGYYSDKRKGEIIIDVSIEFRRTAKSKPSLYVFIECKDYNSPVPVSDVEEFYTKTIQISGLNVKAMFFATSSIQEGGLTFANSVGMAVVRMLDDDSLAWMIERTTSDLTTTPTNSVNVNVINALINEYFVSTKRDTFALVNGIASYQIKDIISALLQSPPKTS